MLTRIICFFNALAIILIILSVSVFTPAFAKCFYDYQFEKRQTALYIGISGEELEAVTENLIDYMCGRADTLEAFVTIDGVVRPFYSEREIYHMEDVRVLFDKGFLLRNISVCVFFAAVLYAFLSKDLKNTSRLTFMNIIAVLAVFLVIVALVAANFERAFTIFHEIFFDNDLWLLTPGKDLLIDIVPLGFFIDTAKTVAVLFIAQITIVSAVLFIIWKKTPSKN